MDIIQKRWDEQWRWAMLCSRALPWLIIFSSMFSGLSFSSTENSDRWMSWPQVGDAQLSWFIFDVYHSRLYSPSGRYQNVEDITPHPFALEIEYQRAISKQKLLDVTRDQWNELNYSQEKQKKWIEKLRPIFPNLKEGDKLIYVTNGDSGKVYFTQVSSKPQIVGNIEDEALNDAFLAIWLSPKTAYPKLRLQLIGANE